MLLLLASARPGFAASFDDAMAAYHREDYAKAAELFRALAQDGNADAQYWLGVLYANGAGVPKSDRDTAQWMLRAAKQGHVRAEVAIGALYGNGTGVPRNFVYAYMWTSLAAANGNEIAPKTLARLEPLMSRGEIAEAQRLAADFVPRPEHGTGPGPDQASFGTGFFVSARGDALTNAHVVNGCSKIIAHRRGKTSPGHVLFRDTRNDLALLSVTGGSTPSFALRLDARLGEDIVVYGFPLPGLLASGGNITTGNVAALAGLRDDSRILQISAPVQPGNSGGPVLDRDGDVIGVVVAKLNAVAVAAAIRDIPENINFAIKSSLAADFLNAHGIAFATAVKGANRPLATSELARRAQAATFQVECRP